MKYYTDCKLRVEIPELSQPRRARLQTHLETEFPGVISEFTSSPKATRCSVTSVVVPPGTAPGSYYVIAVADWNNAVPESFETNNTRASSAVRIGPDLTVSSLNAPASAAAGATIGGSDTTMNQGGESTPVSVTKFYLSTNTTLDAGDPLIGTRQVIALGAGLSNSGSVSLTIPASTAPGTYTIIAKADGDDTIVESSEVNNTRTKTITITP